MSNRSRTFFFVLLAVLVSTALVYLLRPRVALPNRPPLSGANSASNFTNGASPPATPTSVTPPLGSGAAALATRPDFQQRPFPVSLETQTAQWTQADGKDTNVIRQLAHNPLEYARMVDENSRIFRRQLVYLKETAAAVFEQAKLTGEPVRQLTLPGLDGQELQFEVVKSDNKGSSRQGMLSGHLAGNPESLVTLAFQDGREAFTILSPSQNIFVVGEPREPGQIIVKAIDPSTYGMGPADAEDRPRK